MAFVYAGLALFWLFSMIAAKTKSWAFMDIAKFANLVGMVVNLVIVMVLTILVDPKGHFHTENTWLVPFITGLFYLVYVVMSKRYLFIVRNIWSSVCVNRINICHIEMKNLPNEMSRFH